MRRFIIFSFVILFLAAGIGVGYYYITDYWIHRYDELIKRHAKVYRLDEKLVWSVIYEETYFRSNIIGDAKEVGLMQVTPLVARQWAKETGLKEFEKKTAQNVQELLSEPEKNIQIGCWYLEKVSEKYRDFPAENAMTLAAYNAGPSRVEEWTKGIDASKLSEKEFIDRIKIPSTKAYVTSILKRYEELKKSK